MLLVRADQYQIGQVHKGVKYHKWHYALLIIFAPAYQLCAPLGITYSLMHLVPMFV